MNCNVLLKTAVGLALIGACAPVFAVDSSTVAADHLLRIGGATATNNILRDVFLHSTAGLCATGTVDVYEGTNQRLVACRAKTFAVGSPYAAISGENIAYIKESNGGSGNGTGPVANQTSLVFLNPANPTCGAAQNVAAASGLLAYTLHPGCTGTQSIAPEIGIADVEGKLLGFTGTGLTPIPLLDIVFGVPVSLPLYRDLQAAQGLGSDDTCANVPSLTSSQVAAIYTGNIFDASVLVQADQGDNGSQIDGGAQKAIHICRRGNSSGTQAGTQAFFLNQGCASDVAPFFTPDVPQCLAGGCSWPTQVINGVTQNFQDDLVFAGSGSSQVQQCLNFFGGQANDNYAVGVLSTENSTSGQNYRFVRVDGALPTLESTANGNYQFFTSNVMNLGTLSYSADETAIYTYISDAAGSPALLDPLNQPFRDGMCSSATNLGDGGVLASSKFIDAFGFPANHEAPFSGAEIRDNPINTQTKQPLGVINNCQRPVTHPAVEAEAAGGQFRGTIPTF
ncbi:MAG TPA: hypothetical protein VJQ52_19880 [Steroidobacteraceae bacterium]|nr:hypothetical protein [Steroidobacteraceae bacterium]